MDLGPLRFLPVAVDLRYLPGLQAELRDLLGKCLGVGSTANGFMKRFSQQGLHRRDGLLVGMVGDDDARPPDA